MQNKTHNPTPTIQVLRSYRAASTIKVEGLAESVTYDPDELLLLAKRFGQAAVLAGSQEIHPLHDPDEVNNRAVDVLALLQQLMLSADGMALDSPATSGLFYILDWVRESLGQAQLRYGISVHEEVEPSKPEPDPAAELEAMESLAQHAAARVVEMRARMVASPA